MQIFCVTYSSDPKDSLRRKKKPLQDFDQHCGFIDNDVIRCAFHMHNGEDSLVDGGTYNITPTHSNSLRLEVSGGTVQCNSFASGDEILRQTWTAKHHPEGDRWTFHYERDPTIALRCKWHEAASVAVFEAEDNSFYWNVTPISGKNRVYRLEQRHGGDVVPHSLVAWNFKKSKLTLQRTEHANMFCSEFRFINTTPFRVNARVIRLRNIVKLADGFRCIVEDPVDNCPACQNRLHWKTSSDGVHLDHDVKGEEMTFRRREGRLYSIRNNQQKVLCVDEKKQLLFCHSDDFVKKGNTKFPVRVELSLAGECIDGIGCRGCNPCLYCKHIHVVQNPRQYPNVYRQRNWLFQNSTFMVLPSHSVDTEKNLLSSRWVGLPPPTSDSQFIVVSRAHDSFMSTMYSGETGVEEFVQVLDSLENPQFDILGGLAPICHVKLRRTGHFYSTVFLETDLFDMTGPNNYLLGFSNSITDRVMLLRELKPILQSLSPKFLHDLRVEVLIDFQTFDVWLRSNKQLPDADPSCPNIVARVT
eukprot:PhF_6_TR10595/c5_g1_i5/m.17007